MRTCGIGGGGSKALRRAGQRAPVPPAARFGGEEGKRNERCIVVSPAVLKVGRWNRRGGIEGARGQGQPATESWGWEGAVQERTREHILTTYGFEESKMKLPGLSEEGAREEQMPSPQFAIWWELAALVPGAALSQAKLLEQCHRTLQRCAQADEKEGSPNLARQSMQGRRHTLPTLAQLKQSLVMTEGLLSGKEGVAARDTLGRLQLCQMQGSAPRLAAAALGPPHRSLIWVGRTLPPGIGQQLGTRQAPRR